MSPIECIKKGILDGNWETVCDGYAKLTGEILKFPVNSTDNQAQMTLDKISELLNNKIKTSVEVKKKTDVPKKRKKRTSKKSFSVSPNGEDSSLQLDDKDKTPTQRKEDGIRLITNEPDQLEIEINKTKAARAKINKLKIERKEAVVYKIQCNECSAEFESERPKGSLGQKCDSCLRGLKGRFV